MRFPYVSIPMTNPIYSLGGASAREYPLGIISLAHAGITWPVQVVFDTGSDDCLFPEQVATTLGIDLTNAPVGQASHQGMGVLHYRYAPVTIRMSDGIDFAEWSAIVGFVAQPRRWGLLGKAGFFDFFEVLFRGAAKEVVIAADTTFPGTWQRR